MVVSRLVVSTLNAVSGLAVASKEYVSVKTRTPSLSGSARAKLIPSPRS